MQLIRKEDRKENLLYLAMWAGVLAFIALRGIIEAWILNGSSFSFNEILDTWVETVPFLILFLLHNYIAAPLFVNKKKTGLYVALTIFLLALFYLAIFVQGSVLHGIHQEQPWELMEEGDEFFPGPPDPGRGPRRIEALMLLAGIVMVACNLAIKIWFQNNRERERIQQLEKENLKYQLEYLRYQINPHFFMNTLNNIHALVEIDPQQAQDSIVELSKMMRHILYDSDKPTIPLDQELDFLDHYISLMRLRYPDNVEIEFRRPESGGEAEVPPLVYASFVENSFKHGLSAGGGSFVRIGVSVDGGKIIFKCVNGRPSVKAESGGVGLSNVRDRLSLLYADKYTLHVEESDNLYDVLLVIPAKVDR